MIELFIDAVYTEKKDYGFWSDLKEVLLLCTMSVVSHELCTSKAAALVQSRIINQYDVFGHWATFKSLLQWARELWIFSSCITELFYFMSNQSYQPGVI